MAGSTLTADAEDLVALDQRLRNTREIPHAWRGERLVKVKPNVRWPGGATFPRAKSPVEQWQLLVPIDADVVCHLSGTQRYWPRR
jgi:hypothetical protein